MAHLVGAVQTTGVNWQLWGAISGPLLAVLGAGLRLLWKAAQATERNAQALASLKAEQERIDREGSKPMKEVLAELEQSKTREGELHSKVEQIANGG